MKAIGGWVMLRGFIYSCALGASMWMATQSHAQRVTDPLPDITKQGLRVQIVDVAQMPNTQNLRSGETKTASAVARINFFRQLDDGRRFVNDLRGQLYEIGDNQQPSTYLNLHNYYSQNSYYGNGWAAGFISFEMHPEFATNGKFYTIHSETRGSNQPSPDFIANGTSASNSNYHTVVTEWTANTPSASSFSGSKRELLRVGYASSSSYIHPIGDLQFNPTAQLGDDDYGLLYISGGDWNLNTRLSGDPDSLAASVLRIDPRPSSQSGLAAGLGNYSVPSSNPFANDGSSSTLAEVYAYGFRNAHRMAWTEDGQLFVSDIGEGNIEEVNRVVAGGHYGWTDREGTFVNGSDGDDGGDGRLSRVFAINSNTDQNDDFLYPVAQYDHDDGFSIAGGFFYEGKMIPELEGKFIFGDISRGRVFAADANELVGIDITDPETYADIEEIQLFDVNDLGEEIDIDLQEDYFGGGRVDLRFGLGNDGEIYVLTKMDGMVRMLVPEPMVCIWAGLLAALGLRRRRVYTPVANRNI